jgi:RNA polymerase sigma factor (sigma-70 family)
MEVSALPNQSGIAGLRGPSALLRLQSDERLIAMTRRGNHAAFEVLCSRYQSRLLSFCRHMLGSKEDAEDVLQEVFAAAFNAVLADDRPINVRPWLYRIARNRSLNHLRRNTAQGVDSMDVHFAENGLSTSDKVLRRESFRELIADVHELPETQRTALLLREIDAMSYEQIAHAMETTVPSVKSLLVRARISLAEAAEARKLSCEQVRLELGEAAEGLVKLGTPARRHVRGCERCGFFKKQLKQNNHALAAILPVAPLLMLKKVILAKLGMTASAGGAHVAGGAGATVGAGAGAGAAAGAAAGGGSLAGGLMTAGAGALATKAVAGLAAAAIVTAGAVAADHAVTPSRHHHAPIATASATTVAATRAPAELLVANVHTQPTSAGGPSTGSKHHAAHKPAKPAVTPAVTTTAPVPAPPVTVTTPAETPAPVQVTEVTTETTALPTTATSGETPPPAPVTTPTVTAPAPEAPPVASTPTSPPVETHAIVKAPHGTGGTPGPARKAAREDQRALERAARRAAASSGS